MLTGGTKQALDYIIQDPPPLDSSTRPELISDGKSRKVMIDACSMMG